MRKNSRLEAFQALGKGLAWQRRVRAFVRNEGRAGAQACTRWRSLPRAWDQVHLGGSYHPNRESDCVRFGDRAAETRSNMVVTTVTQLSRLPKYVESRDNNE